MDSNLILELMMKERQRSLFLEAEEQRLLKELDPASISVGRGGLDGWLRSLVRQVRMLI